jgi:hypothetical protein
MAQWTTTYSGLVSLLEDYVEDGSTEFEDAKPGIINRAETRILRDLDLDIFNTTSTITTTNGVGFVSRVVTVSPVHSIFVTAASEFAQRRSREYIQAHGGSGRPLYYCDDETKIYFAPTPDDSYSLTATHIVWPTKLSTDQESNWVSTNAADLLLYAALIESEKFLIAPERVAEFEQTYASLLGPTRAFWRDEGQKSYEPVAPTPTPERTR